MKRAIRSAPGGSRFASTAIVYSESQISSEPFTPGAPPPWPTQRTPSSVSSLNPKAYLAPFGVTTLPGRSLEPVLRALEAGARHRGRRGRRDAARA
jgi:hypothetical protein